MMMLKSLKLHDVYGFRDLDLRFASGPVTVLIGLNGAGKSTVLDSISMFLAPLAALLRGTEPRKAKYGLTRSAMNVAANRVGAKLAIVASGRLEQWEISAGPLDVKAVIDPAMSRFARAIHEALAADPSATVPVFCYYPALRFYVYEGFTRKRTKVHVPLFPQLAAYDNAFEMGQHSFEGIVSWFRREEDLENEIRLGGRPDHRNPNLEAVRQAVLRFMNTLSTEVFADMRIRRDPANPQVARLVLKKHGEELPLYNLSDGERGCIALIADLAQRLVAANPNAMDPLCGAGVVLIDEIELHLHPAWQRRILPALVRTFPGCQFIVTTHSPQVLSRVQREHIRLLSSFRVVERLPHTEGRDTSAILSELMGVPRRPEDALAAVNELARLLDNEDLEAARSKLEALEDRFGPDDSDVLRLGAMLRAMEDRA